MSFGSFTPLPVRCRACGGDFIRVRAQAYCDACRVRQAVRHLNLSDETVEQLVAVVMRGG